MSCTDTFIGNTICRKNVYVHILFFGAYWVWQSTEFPNKELQRPYCIILDSLIVIHLHSYTLIKTQFIFSHEFTWGEPKFQREYQRIFPPVPINGMSDVLMYTSFKVEKLFFFLQFIWLELGHSGFARIASYSSKSTLLLFTLTFRIIRSRTCTCYFMNK